MNKIAVFGATGQTGLCVLKSAIEKGVKIRALIRDLSKLPTEYEGKIDIVQGDVLNVEDVKKTLEGQDAVIVVLGTRNDLGPTTVMSEGLKNILAGMKALNINVVSVCLSAFLFRKPEEVPPMFHEVNADHMRMFNVMKASDLQWIAVYAPHIADEPPTGYITKHDEPPNHRIISKYDLGQFFVDSVSMPEHYQKIVGLASNPKK
uniref:NAD(P)-binding domain-containing protein n=1 Tax=Homalodisca liturata TaxID=320908 RepID=A0A1B6JSL3_9HEMI